MTKGITKKKNRKLRKQIRKTVGALFMASAIVIAAIPVRDVSAKPEDTTPVKVAVTHDESISPIKDASINRYKSSVPLAQKRNDSSEKIVYTSGDGTFQFVYLRRTETDVNKVAMILEYNAGPRPDSSLTIPEKLEAYRQYVDNTSRQGYCLVSKNDSFLYYESETQRKDPTTQALMFYVPAILDQTTNMPLEVNEYDTHIKRDENGNRVYVRSEDSGEDDADGNPIMKDVTYAVTAIMDKVMYPCYYAQKSEWENVKDEDLYYLPPNSDATDVTAYRKANSDNEYWKINADVAFIGNEKIKSDNRGGWQLDGYITKPEEGVFAGQNNITNLTVGGNIIAIGDYAFYGCSTLQNVSLANGLQNIGNGTFGECIRLQACNIASNANIEAIGKDAFYNCRALSSFSIPIGLRALGDNCFEGCTSLTSVDLTGGGGAMALTHLGNSLFKGCSSLASLEFPFDYTESDLSINMFDGCSSLQFVKIPNASINFVEKDTEAADGSGFKEFKNTVPASFYFEGPAGSNIHKTASKYSIAFKYLGEDLYELIVEEKGTGGSGTGGKVKVTYQVNSQNELVKFWIETNGKPENVTIPETIGPFGISAIGVGSFNDNCDLKKITIPASVVSIGENAFKGCHSLETVIYTDAITMQTIGQDAFKTQETSCEHSSAVSAQKNPKLTFVGAMYNPATGEDTVPFIYAMNGVSNINNGNQEKSFITCHSGWPTNLEVKYNYDPIKNIGEAQLQKYPKYTDDLKRTPIEGWLNELPYITTDNIAEYKTMVQDAVRKYDEYTAGTSTEQPTDNEMAIINSALNIVIPKSVDSIKTGIFSGVDNEGQNVTDGYRNKEIESIVLNGVNEVEPYTFQGCIKLKNASVIGPVKIDDYAFDGCTELDAVTLGENLTDTGVRPFKGCEKLTSINCLGANFSYGNGILFQNTAGGKTIVECLEGRGNIIGSFTVGPEELAGVTAIKEEAFQDCKEIGKIDLSATTVDVIPEKCFKGTNNLNSVVLPDTVKNIEKESFQDSGIRLLTIPGNQAIIEKDAFKSTPQQKIIFECIEGTTADRYAKAAENSSYITPEYGKVYLEHTVYFWDYPNYPDTSEKSIFHKVKVKDGEDAVPPADTPIHEGHRFSRWTDYTNITRDTDVYPIYGANTYAVVFVNWDGTPIGDVQYIEEGKSAVPPAEDPVREGYTFKGWLGDYHNVTSDLTILPDFVDNSSSASQHKVTFYSYDGKTVLDEYMVNHGDKARTPIAPAREGYTFIGWVPDDLTNIISDKVFLANYEKNSDSGNNGGSTPNPNASASPTSSKSPSPSPTASASPTATPRTYTVSVSGGSGSGNYAAGSIVTLNAYAMGTGQVFEKWTTSTAGVGFADATATSTSFTMPAANVAITATYKTGNGTNTAAGGSGTTGTNGTNGTSGGSSASTGTGSGTTVEVTKPGISNTGLAGATVTGATDNFVVKITEDEAATQAAIAALQAKYGDISRIKYLPMDISLYDSTGRTKIADTSGISVNITLPLPDDMVEYAGNNKMASTANNSLEDMNTRFTTVDGVPCINFTATHFSPYVVYVDTANLTEATIDATPKTGDPIHPKWFLATGLACVALILFFKRDRAVIPAKTA